MNLVTYGYGIRVVPGLGEVGRLGPSSFGYGVGFFFSAGGSVGVEVQILWDDGEIVFDSSDFRWWTVQSTDLDNPNTLFLAWAFSYLWAIERGFPHRVLMSRAFEPTLDTGRSFNTKLTQEGAFKMVARFSSSKREYFVGESVELGMNISAPKSNSPIDPDTVVLQDLTDEAGNTVAGFTPTSLNKIEVGQYELTISTATIGGGLAAGEYRMFVYMDTGTSRTIARDRFVLAPLNSP